MTFTCCHRLPYLNDDRSRTVFEEVLETTRKRQGFDVYGYVLMPNHVHLLLSEPRHHALADTFRALKTQTSRKLKGDRKQFWQRRYFDRNIITYGEFVEKLQYIHRNPSLRSWSNTRKTGLGAAIGIGSPAKQAGWRSSHTGHGLA